MKKVIGILMFTLASLTLFAQDFEVPQNYKFTSKEDFAKYENDVLKCATWLISNPITMQPEKRKEAGAFFIQWLSGTPNLSIEIKPKVVTFMESNPDLLVIFMCGWAKYALDTKDTKNKVMGNQKGIEAVIDFYTKNKEQLKKDKNVEKFIKMKEEGKLEGYISSNS